MRRLHIIWIAVIAVMASALAGCNGTPDYVIPPKKMAEVLADMHASEAVVDIDHSQYENDTCKLELKQAIFDKHNITEETFDTSLVWYAHNINKYMDLYDRTIEVLEDRAANAGSMLSMAAVSVAGDSVDVWMGSRFLHITDRMPSAMISWDLQRDDNWEPGDMYTARIKTIDAEGTSVNWAFVANYSDSTVDYLSSVTSQNGWNELTFISDSTRQLERVRGFFEPIGNKGADVWIDSITLVRKRIDPSKYQQRYRVRSYRSYY